MAISARMPTSKERESSGPSDAALAGEKSLHAFAPMRVTATPPYLDPDSHEAVYDIDVATLT